MVQPDGADFAVLPPSPSEMDYALHWLIREKSSGSILDVGCAGLRLLLNASWFNRREGVDIAAFPVWSRHPNITTGICDLNQQHLSQADNAFDAVTCLMVVEHVFDPFHAVRELRRVCAPHGRVIIGVPNIAGIKRRFELLLGRLPITSSRGSFGESAWDGYHLHNFTLASLAWLLRSEGLEPIRWAAQGQFKLFKQRFPSLLGNDLIVMAKKAEPQPGLPFPE